MSILRIFFLGAAFLFITNGYSQKKINDYKYVIVPASYGFLNKTDEYQLNSLSKFLFNKYGFKTFMRGEDFPEELKKNGCLGLTANVKKNSGLFMTKLSITLKDCNGSILFSSSEGTSREKEYKRAYHEALRKAFKGVEKLNYRYNGSKDNTSREEVFVKQEDSKQEVSSEKSVVKPEGISLTNPPNNDTSSQKKSIELLEKKKPTQAISYVFNDVAFVFEKRDFGFELFQNKEGESISIGKVFKSANGTNYIVKAGDYSGNGYFDAYGNFVLERINPVTNKLITDIFARQ